MIADKYLAAPDLASLPCLSQKLRRFFAEVLVLPGLFKTPHGFSHGCQLHEHQYSSLLAMRRMENQSTKFGALRGGLLSDAPGLGKTVTVMALVSSTAGTLPLTPKIAHSAEMLQEKWDTMHWEEKHRGCRQAMYNAIHDTR